MSKYTVHKLLATLFFVLTLIVSFYINEQLPNLIKDSSYQRVTTALLLVCAFALLNMITTFALAKKQTENTLPISEKSVNIETKTKVGHPTKKDEIDISIADVSGVVTRIMSEVDNLNDLSTSTEKLLIKIAKEFPIVQGLFFVKEKSSEWFILKGKYAFYSEREIEKFQSGEGLSGQVAKDKRVMNISNVPQDYITIISGLGKGSPQYLFILPIIEADETVALLELASFAPFTPIIQKTLEVLGDKYSSEISRLR